MRLSSGSSAMSFEVTTPPISERVVSMSGVPTLTVTASVTAPTASSRASVGAGADEDVDVLADRFLEALSSALTV